MNAGLLQLGNSLLSYERQMAVISNNISNADTNRYKNDTLTTKSFVDYFVEEVENREKNVHLEYATNTSFTQGLLEGVSDNNQFAIDGEGFIEVSLNGNQVYSRGGKLASNEEGFLVDSNNNLVMGENGPIQVTDNQFVVSTNGVVESSNSIAGKIKLVSFTNNSGLSKLGDDYYLNSSNQQIVESQAKLKQGYVEKSNTDITNEYLRMMEISRMYETNQKVVQILDDIYGKAANDIGRLY